MPAQTRAWLPWVACPDRSNGFAGIAGGGLDIEVIRPLAIRLIQVDYNYIQFDMFGVKGLHSNAVRISTGLVIRF